MLSLQVTDPLCKPFSMGRNLFCVHSKKRLDDVPELKSAKQRQNRLTLVTMQKMLNQVRLPAWHAPGKLRHALAKPSS